MKFSFKYLLLFFAVGMMTVVACGDDDSDDPTPTPPPSGNGNGNGGGNGGGDTLTTGIFAIVNQDSIDFTSFSAVLDTFTFPSVIEINGSNSAKNASINIVLAENYTGTADPSKPNNNQRVSFRFQNSGSDIERGTITITQNDSVVAGTFEFDGTYNFTNDTLAVDSGRFNIPIQR